jgi:hypothetical protein
VDEGRDREFREANRKEDENICCVATLECGTPLIIVQRTKNFSIPMCCLHRYYNRLSNGKDIGAGQKMLFIRG